MPLDPQQPTRAVKEGRVETAMLALAHLTSSVILKMEVCDVVFLFDFFFELPDSQEWFLNMVVQSVCFFYLLFLYVFSICVSEVPDCEGFQVYILYLSEKKVSTQAFISYRQEGS